VPASEQQEPEIYRLQEEVKRLREERDLWMNRSLGHAMEADRLREERLNLKVKVWELSKEKA
jgi:hypothetical protein